MVYNNQILGKGRNEVNETKNVSMKLSSYLFKDSVTEQVSYRFNCTARPFF